MRKQFKDIDIYAGIKAQDGAKWIKDNGIEANWKTPEHIDVRRGRCSCLYGRPEGCRHRELHPREVQCARDFERI